MGISINFAIGGQNRQNNFRKNFSHGISNRMRHDTCC